MSEINVWAIFPAWNIDKYCPYPPCNFHYNCQNLQVTGAFFRFRANFLSTTALETWADGKYICISAHEHVFYSVAHIRHVQCTVYRCSVKAESSLFFAHTCLIMCAWANVAFRLEAHILEWVCGREVVVRYCIGCAVNVENLFGDWLICNTPLYINNYASLAHPYYSIVKILQYIASADSERRLDY